MASREARRTTWKLRAADGSAHGEFGATVEAPSQRGEEVELGGRLRAEEAAVGDIAMDGQGQRRRWRAARQQRGWRFNEQESGAEASSTEKKLRGGCRDQGDGQG
jgi:hypothetical protein